MAKQYGPYIRMTRLRRMLGGMAQLWRTEDYLLHVNSTGFTERYQRFYFRDIQGIFVCPNNRRRNIALWLGVVQVVFLLIGAIATSWVPVFIGLALTLPLHLINLIKGPSVELALVTRVQTRRLEAIGRRKAANKLMHELRPLIEGAQADLMRSEEPPPVPPPGETAAAT